ncbi:Protein of unknown function [Alkalithermobacter thermoalcaliphilus JW-YL-7 = DSM 7308]|uniref:DUF2508 family protein n=1 Tax=Alkalithermobacter thermoalcaliphilus JW-YL-7 = DSM 7308 TaxID=1121328 RepID=A0A150FMR1_CLOPD|nr:Protein of unknown function DUF2508 [[Clostridium] paradoxum JW-YL-7 = DSM 7308]SHL36842.1 Protein of unknown function [[Clostridium] paradoxum JW-YL-7 = DSM 7308]
MNYINFFKKEIDEDEQFINELKSAYLDLKSAESFFESVKDPDLVDYAVFRLEAARSRYSYFLKKAKENNIRSKSVYNL